MSVIGNGSGTAVEPTGLVTSKMAAVRLALKKLGKKTKPLKIQAYLKRHFGIEMSTNAISNYKSGIVSKKSNNAKAAKKTTAVVPVTANVKQADGISLQDIQQVKNLASRVGPGNLLALIDLIAK